jgi:polar amino acid transport system substrate-binding protein
MMKRAGMEADIRLAPWEEGYRAVLEQPNTVLFSMAMTPERKPLMQWVGPIAVLEANLYAAKVSRWGIATLEDAKKIPKIVVVRDYYTEQLLKKEGFTNLETVDTEEIAVRKLLSGEAQLFPGNNITMPALMRKVNASADDVKGVLTLSTNSVYVAFSKQTSSELVARWQRALDEMKADGTFEKIYRHYLPHADMTGLLSTKESSAYHPGECRNLSFLPPKEKDLLEFVCRAKAFTLSNIDALGKEKGLAVSFQEFSRQAADPECRAGKCPFQKGELYLFAYENEMQDSRTIRITCRAHGANPSMIGKNFFDTGFMMKAYPQYGIKQRQDAKFFQMVSDAAYRKNGYPEGFVLFVWPNPMDENRIWLKRSYSTTITDSIWIGSGIYLERVDQK